MPGHKIRAERKAAGLCEECGKPRGEDGTAKHCRKCAIRHNKKQASRNQTMRAYRRAHNQCLECGERLLGKKDTLCSIHKYKKSLTDKRYYSRLTRR